MIKNAACIVALMAPCLSLALEQKELSTPPRLNLQLQSANLLPTAKLCALNKCLTLQPK